jgi:hypothetical protein
MTPYQGVIELGPEIFEEVNENFDYASDGWSIPNE